MNWRRQLKGSSVAAMVGFGMNVWELDDGALEEFRLTTGCCLLDLDLVAPRGRGGRLIRRPLSAWIIALTRNNYRFLFYSNFINGSIKFSERKGVFIYEII